MWRLRYDGAVLDAYLSAVGGWGFVFEFYLDGRFCYSERFDSEPAARQALSDEIRRRLADGWTYGREFIRMA